MVRKSAFIKNSAQTYSFISEFLKFRKAHTFWKTCPYRYNRLPFTYNKKRKIVKKKRRAQMLPYLTFFSIWVWEYSRMRAFTRHYIFFCLIHPLPLCLMLHRAPASRHRDEGVIRDYLDDNNMFASFLPSRYVRYFHRFFNHRGTFLNVRSIPMYSPVYVPALGEYETHMTTEAYDQQHKLLTESSHTPVVLYYDLAADVVMYKEWINDVKNDNAAITDFFHQVESYQMSIILEIYKLSILLILFKQKKCVACC